MRVQVKGRKRSQDLELIFVTLIHTTFVFSVFIFFLKKHVYVDQCDLNVDTLFKNNKNTEIKNAEQ